MTETVTREKKRMPVAQEPRRIPSPAFLISVSTPVSGP